jgi:hypothetical protein
LDVTVIGEGGFQSFLRKLRSQTVAGKLTVFPDDLRRLIRYVNDYGQGGFQTRLGSLAEQIEGVIDDLRDALQRESERTDGLG